MISSVILINDGTVSKKGNQKWSLKISTSDPVKTGRMAAINEGEILRMYHNGKVVRVRVSSVECFVYTEDCQGRQFPEGCAGWVIIKTVQI